MRNSRFLLGITILGTALAGACSENGAGTQVSGGSAGGGSGISNTGGNIGTGGSSNLGGATAGGAGSGGAVASGGSTGSGGATGTGGANDLGGNTTGGAIDSGGTAATGGATEDTGGATHTGGATGGATATGGVTGGGGGGKAGSTATGGATGGATGTGGAAVGGSGGKVGSTATGGATGTGGVTGGGSGGKAGSTATGGTTSTGGATGGATGTGGLPALHVEGTVIKNSSGQTVVLRGTALIDIGALYAYGGNSVDGIKTRMQKVAAAGLQGTVVRLPVYPKIDYNGGGSNSYCSPLPYPVGSGPGAGCTPNTPMTAADYFGKVLKPAVDYATSQNLYVIIDFHQIDNATTGTSAADATTFWTDIAPKFAGYANVLYEPFNEPIDGSASWATFKPVVQSWITTIRTGAPDNIIIVPSMSYDQHPGDAASNAPTGANLVYTAHIYPGNWSTSFKTQVATAVAKAPVFITEWGYILNGGDKTLGTTSATWGTDFEALVDANGASWTAWVTDNSWTPSLFSNSALTTLTDFGTVVKNWLQPR